MTKKKYNFVITLCGKKLINPNTNEPFKFGDEWEELYFVNYRKAVNGDLLPHFNLSTQRKKKIQLNQKRREHIRIQSKVGRSLSAVAYRLRSSIQTSTSKRVLQGKQASNNLTVETIEKRLRLHRDEHTGQIMELFEDKTRHPTSASIDRKNNENYNYIDSNVQVITFLHNNAKSNFEYEDLELFSKHLLLRQNRRHRSASFNDALDLKKLEDGENSTSSLFVEERKNIAWQIASPELMDEE